MVYQVFRSLFIGLLFFASLGADPFAVYLTWDKSPESTMRICWITALQTKPQELKVREVGSEDWFSVSIDPIPLPQGMPYALYAYEMEALKPDQRYEFALPEDSRPHFFATMPAALSRPVRFVVGGDVYHDAIELVIEMNRKAASKNPDFALIGGDIAYASRKFSFLEEDVERWMHFIKAWSDTMVKSDGTLIPIIAAIGNHDVDGRYNETPVHAKCYYLLFRSGDQGYQAIDFGSYLSLLILDSGHTHPVAGEQTKWLDETLQARRDMPYKFALYHVPAYPSVRAFQNEKCKQVRQNWVPLFEKWGLTSAFEHHDHAYKRTQLIKEGKVNPQGVLYLGDGAWGVARPRRPRSPANSWYLAKSTQARHFILVTLQGGKSTYQAINQRGVVFDDYTR